MKTGTYIQSNWTGKLSKVELKMGLATWRESFRRRSIVLEEEARKAKATGKPRPRWINAEYKRWEQLLKRRAEEAK
jgi:hypothetical protein